MYEIPTELEIGGQSFAIRNKGDYRMVLDCFAALDDEELTKRERLLACLLIFYEDLTSLDDLNKFSDLEEAITKMYQFFNCGQDSSIGVTANYKLIDWDKDSQLISSAINNVAHKEIRLEPYIHWWTFMGYYTSIGESTLTTVVNIRHKIATGKKLEKYESAFRRDNPKYFNWDAKTVERKEADELAKQLWNSNG